MSETLNEKVPMSCRLRGPLNINDAVAIDALEKQYTRLDSQIKRLADFIIEEVPGEPSQSEGAIDTAIRWMRSKLNPALTAGEQEPVAWVPEDELPESLPSWAYDALFPHSRIDGIRFFPIYLAPPTAQLEALRKELAFAKAALSSLSVENDLNKRMFHQASRAAETAEARVAELEAELSDWKNGHANSVRAHAAALARAESQWAGWVKEEVARKAAEARVAELEKAGAGMRKIVEEIDGTMKHGTWRDEKGNRLKDTPEWVEFYNTTSARRVREGEKVDG